MKIYEIDAAIEELIAGSVDEETGEILVDPEKLDALQMEREAAVENLALYYKNLTAEAKAIKAEEEALAKRRRSTENAAERAKKYLEYALRGEKFKSARVAVSYRKSQAVELDENAFMSWAKFYMPGLVRASYKEEPNKDAIKDALKEGVKVCGASLIDKQSIQVK